MVPFSQALKSLRRRRIVALAAVLGMLIQGLVPVTASAHMPIGDPSELFGGKIAVCSPFGISYVEVEPGEPVPKPAPEGGCVKCCPFALDALSLASLQARAEAWYSAGPYAISAQTALGGASALGRQAPRAPPTT